LSEDVDEETWQMLRAVVAAARSGDKSAFLQENLHLARSLPWERQRVATLYLYYLLRVRLAHLVGHKPSAADLHAVAECADPDFTKITQVDVARFEGVLLSAYDLAPAPDEVRGGELAVGMAAALGVLLDDQLSGYDTMRPHLADWCRRNPDRFRPGST